MLKKKNIKNIGRIISFILILSVFSGSSLAYGSSIEVGEAITFDFIVRDINISELNIDAEDALGNRFTLTAGLIW